MESECKRCGLCCMAIPWNSLKRDLKKFGKGDKGDYGFVSKNWVRIGRKKAIALNPRLAHSPGKYFYTCKQLDREKKLCKIQDSKPYVCKGYPWYGGTHDPGRLISLECGYNHI